MGLLIIYILVFLIIASIKIYIAPDYINSIKVIISSLFFPLDILFFLLNIPLYLVGVNLQFKSTIILSKKEQEIMTDKVFKELSDTLEVLSKKRDEDEEK